MFKLFVIFNISIQTITVLPFDFSIFISLSRMSLSLPLFLGFSQTLKHNYKLISFFIFLVSLIYIRLLITTKQLKTNHCFMSSTNTLNFIIYKQFLSKNIQLSIWDFVLWRLIIDTISP